MKFLILSFIITTHGSGIVKGNQETATIPGTGLYQAYPEQPSRLDQATTGSSGTLPITTTKISKKISKCYQCMGQSGTNIRDAEVCFENDLEGIV